MPATYAYQQKTAKRTARASLRGINASFKDLCEVCRSVRGKDTDYAIDFLEQAAVGEKAIYFARHNKGKGHRRELGGRKGGWPVKSVKFVLGVVKSAAANATKLSLGQTKVAHIIANKVDMYPRMSPKGRRIRQDFETAFIEVVLEESQEKVEAKKKDSKKEAAAKPVEAKKAETASDIKKSEMSSTDTKRPVEGKKLEAGRKEAPRFQ